MYFYGTSTLWGVTHTDLPPKQLHGPLKQLVCILRTLLRKWNNA